MYFYGDAPNWSFILLGRLVESIILSLDRFIHLFGNRPGNGFIGNTSLKDTHAPCELVVKPGSNERILMTVRDTQLRDHRLYLHVGK